MQRVKTESEVLFVFAIVESGGKQYKVSEGDIIFVEKLNVNEGGLLPGRLFRRHACGGLYCDRERRQERQGQKNPRYPL